MRTRKRLFRRGGDDARGAALVLTAMTMVLLLWAGATGVDVGFTIYGSRQAQAIADTAALDLARYLGYADTLTSISDVQTYLNEKLATVLTNNGSDAHLIVVPGYFNTSTGKFNGVARPVNRPFMVRCRGRMLALSPNEGASTNPHRLGNDRKES